MIIIKMHLRTKMASNRENFDTIKAFDFHTINWRLPMTFAISSLIHESDELWKF